MLLRDFHGGFVDDLGAIALISVLWASEPKLPGGLQGRKRFANPDFLCELALLVQVLDKDEGYRVACTWAQMKPSPASAKILMGL